MLRAACCVLRAAGWSSTSRLIDARALARSRETGGVLVVGAAALALRAHAATQQSGGPCFSPPASSLLHAPPRTPDGSASCDRAHERAHEGWGRNDAPLARAPQKEKLPLVTTLANVLQMGPPSEAAPAPAAAKPRKVPPAPLLRDTVVLGVLAHPPRVLRAATGLRAPPFHAAGGEALSALRTQSSMWKKAKIVKTATHAFHKEVAILENLCKDGQLTPRQLELSKAVLAGQ